jgi:hypothetical protein
MRLHLSVLLLSARMLSVPLLSMLLLFQDALLNTQWDKEIHTKINLRCFVTKPVSFTIPF